MFLITHSRGFALNFPATRYTKSGSIIVGLQEKSYNIVVALAFSDWHDEFAMAWVFPKHLKPVLHRSYKV